MNQAFAEGPWGELAALGTACCWVVTSLAFAQAGGRIGSLTVNLIRLVMALPMLCVVSFFLRGQWFPLDATAGQWQWLSLSGLVGFLFGDMCLFQAFVVIGPRLSSLIMATAPVMTAVIGWAVLGETLGFVALCGMLLTIGGVCFAIVDRKASMRPTGRDLRIGVFLALGGALGQAAGLVLSKYGMGSYDAFAATQIRVVAAIGGWLLVFVGLRGFGRVRKALRDERAMSFTALGAFFGPVAGVGLSLVAVQRTNAGIAASLMSITPILMIPVGRLFYGERVGTAGLLGTVAAVAGVALLFAT